MKMTVEEIAQKLGGRAEGDLKTEITSLAGITDAHAGDLSFIASPKYANAAANTKASAVIVQESWDRPCPSALIRVKNPDNAFAEAAKWFAPPPIEFIPGIHTSAIIAKDAQIGRDVYVGPHCVLEPGVKIGDRCVLVAGCYVGHGVTIGDDTKLYPSVTIREYARIGSRVIIHNGTVVGSDGFGYAQDGAARKKIPQIGIVVIGDDVEIGANTTIDRARFGQTRIGKGVKIDNLVQIGHNVTIGDNVVVVAQVGIAGSTSVGDRTILAGQVGLAGHLSIGSDVVIGAQSGVSNDVPSRTFMLGSPADDYRKTKKIFAIMSRLPELREKIRAMESKLAELEAKLGAAQKA